MLLCLLFQSLRMAYILMALFANTAKIALLLAICIRVKNIKGELRELLHVLLVVDKFCPAIPTFFFVDLTLIPIQF